MRLALTATLVAALSLAQAAAPRPARAAEDGVALDVEEVAVAGNDRTSTDLIVRVLGVRPGEPLSEIAVQRGRLALLSLGFFVDVRVSLRKGSRRGYVTLLVEVEERPTVIVNDLFLGIDDATPFWGGIDLSERNLLGTGLGLSGAFVAGSGQQAFRLGMSDPAVLGSGVSVSTATWAVLGSEPVVAPDPSAGVRIGDGPAQPWQRVPYRRFGGVAGAGVPLTGTTTLFVDYRYESVWAEPPHVLLRSGGAAGGTRYLSPGVQDGNGRISSLAVTLARDTRNDHFLPTAGSFTLFAADLSHRMLGATWDFARFRGHFERWWHLGGGHALQLSLGGGLLVGEAPFYEHFFIGDVHDAVPSRPLGVNFAVRRPPEVLGSTLDEKRYEDVFGRIEVEYDVPLSGGRQPYYYRSDLFLAVGLVGLTSSEDLLGFEPSDAAARPVDLTADLGFRFDTPVGIFALSLKNVLELVPFP